MTPDPNASAGTGAAATPRPGAVLGENEVVNRLNGERFVFTRSSRDTGGAFVAFDFYVAPGGGVPLQHRHTTQEEVFECVRGELTIHINGTPRRLGPGERVALPPGTVHSFVNQGAVETMCRVEYRPAGRNEDWLKVVNAPVVLLGRPAGMLELAPFILDVDLSIAGPPVWAQKLLFGLVLRPLARLLGRRRAMLAMASRVYGRPFGW